MTRIRTKIKDLDTFKEVCDKHDVTAEDHVETYRGQSTVLRLLDNKNAKSSQEMNKIFVVKGDEEDTYNLMMDQDRGYCSLTARIGNNGGRLMRDYVTEQFKKEAQMRGGMIMEENVLDNNKVKLRIAMG